MARYIAAILAEHGPDTANWLDLHASEREGLTYRNITVLPLSGIGEDPQLWGLEFRIRDGIALPESFRCYMAWEGGGDLMPSAVGTELLATSPARGVIHRTGTISGVMSRRSRASMFGAVLRHCAMRACACFAIMVAVAAVASCGVLGGHGKHVRLQELPPTRAAVIDAALRSHDVPLTVHSSCTDVGDDQDPTVGRYLRS